MRAWNSYSDDLTLKDGSVVKEYTIRFKTTEYEVYKRIERFFQALMDEPNCSEKPNNSLDKDTNVRSKYDCKTCKHDLWHTPRMCGKCVRQEDGKPSMYEPKTEPQTCSNCKFDHEEWFEEACDSCCDAHSNWHPKTEPQNHSGEVTEMVEPQTDCAWKGEK